MRRQVPCFPRWLQKRQLPGLGGMEFAAGIPGSMGGAVTMNAGAYGGEMKDVIRQVTVLTPECEQKVLSREELNLSYRHSCIPKNHFLVLEAELSLTPAPEQEIRAKMAELREKRVEKQPLEYPSAGSTFKRPEGYFAGKLIMDAGLRGYAGGGCPGFRKTLWICDKQRKCHRSRDFAADERCTGTCEKTVWCDT